MASEIKVDTISEKTSGNGVTIDGALIKDGNVAGITSEIDVWALTANIAGTNADITSNLSRATGTNIANKGTGMTESSGIFTFPSTGYWQVTAKGYIQVLDDTSAVIAIKTTDNNSTYTNVSYTGAGHRSTAEAHYNIETSIILEIDDTSNDKVKFATLSFESDSTLQGDAAGLDTRFTFVKLGDL